MEARSQLRHRPTCGGMQLPYCLRSGSIRQTPASSGMGPPPQVAELGDSTHFLLHRPAANRLGPAPEKAWNRCSCCQGQRKGKQNLRDREHFRGVPVSKTMEHARHSDSKPVSRSRVLHGSIGSWLADFSARGQVSATDIRAFGARMFVSEHIWQCQVCLSCVKVGGH
jgi:hypothetical protein